MHHFCQHRNSTRVVNENTLSVCEVLKRERERESKERERKRGRERERGREGMVL
jgi:hypothetical protein